MKSVKDMAKTTGLSEQTCRLLLQKGFCGEAIKGRGSRYIYLIRWDEVLRYAENNRRY